MAYTHHDIDPTLFPVDEQWLRADVPADLAQVIADEFGDDDRERLGRAAAAAAVAEVKDAYQSPFVKHAAQSAVRYALGLKSLPESDQESGNG